MITLQSVTPVGLCIATEDLFDAKRLQQNFCDNLLLRSRDKNLEPILVNMKREINSSMKQGKYMEGYKVVIANNIDKILSLVSARYAASDLKTVDSIVNEGKKLLDKVLNAESFDRIAMLAPEFKTKISLPVYGMFIKSLK